MTDLVRVQNVHYSGVLHGVDLRVGPGELVALTGPNGSGKTTLLKIILGLLAPDAGQVLLYGRDPRALRPAKRVGYVPQRPVVDAAMPTTVNELVATGRLAARAWWRPMSRKDAENVTHALEAVDLLAMRRRPLSELSGGEQQRAFIARAMAGEPELLVCDEPVAGVDAGAQRRFRDSLVHHIEHHRGAVLLVSHELAALEADLTRVISLVPR